MIEITPPPADRDEELYDLTAKCFSGDYFGFLNDYLRSYYPASSYDRTVSRVAMADGRIVAHVGVWDYAMRVGTARLRTGGIGAVGTHADFRRRGIAARLMRATLAAMRRRGYHYTALFGIRDYYDRFGFVQAWPEMVLTAGTGALPSAAPKLSLRRVPVTQVIGGTGRIGRIYSRDNATRTGTAVRPIFTLSRFPKDRCDALTDDAGRIRGYIVTRGGDDELRVLEVGGLGRACGTGQLLAAIALLARRARRRRIRLVDFPYSHPLCEALRACDCRIDLHHKRSGSAMGAVVSLRGALEAMAEELTRRLAGSACAGFRGTVTISGAGEKVSLKVSGGRVRVAAGAPKTADRIVAGNAAARLLIGSAPPAELAGGSGVKFHGRAAELAEVLFPQQWPALCALDHY